MNEWLRDNWQWAITTVIALASLWFAYRGLNTPKEQSNNVPRAIKTMRQEVDSTHKITSDSIAFRKHVKIICFRILNVVQVTFFGTVGVASLATHESHQQPWLGVLGLAAVFIGYLFFMRLYYWDKENR